METVITSEQDLKEHLEPLPKDVVLIHFKLVGIGANTLAKSEYLGSNICDIVQQQPGFFVISRNGVGLREAMHDLVDRFCNIQEGKNESKNS
jgi:hypothetical protein